MNNFIRLHASTIGTIYGNANCWHLTQPATSSPHRLCERQIELEIVGDDQQGFYLVISPKGFFTADMHCSSLIEAKSYAKTQFGVNDTAWQTAEQAIAC